MPILLTIYYLCFKNRAGLNLFHRVNDRRSGYLSPRPPAKRNVSVKFMVPWSFGIKPIFRRPNWIGGSGVICISILKSNILYIKLRALLFFVFFFFFWQTNIFLYAENYGEIVISRKFLILKI